jgi:SAM-dependent methyltransferase
MTMYYSSQYASDYACLWSYGKELLGLNGTELLYKAVSDNALKSLMGLEELDGALVVDIGCGTGRNIRDLAREMASTRFIGVDASPEMLSVARSILLGSEDVSFSPTQRGFPKISMKSNDFRNVELLTPGEFISNFSLSKQQADICISVNSIERVVDVDDYIRLISTSLRTSGRLIIASSLNWDREEYWSMFPSFSSLLEYLCKNDQFKIVTGEEKIQYFEQTDIRGAGEYYIVSLAELERLG